MKRWIQVRAFFSFYSLRPSRWTFQRRSLLHACARVCLLSARTSGFQPRPVERSRTTGENSIEARIPISSSRRSIACRNLRNEESGIAAATERNSSWKTDKPLWLYLFGSAAYDACMTRTWETGPRTLFLELIPLTLGECEICLCWRASALPATWGAVHTESLSSLGS